MNKSLMSKALWILPALTALYYGDSITTEPSDPPTLDPITQTETPTLASETDKQPTTKGDDETISTLRADLSEVEKRIQKREAMLKERAKNKRNSEAKQLLVKEGLTPDQWDFSGYNSPDRSLESLLWAGAAGSTETMESALFLDEEGHRLAKKLFQNLPADIQHSYETPERIIALNTIDKIPLAHAKIVSEISSDENQSTLTLLFSSNIDSPKFVKLDLLRDENDQWRVFIPSTAIVDYANELGIELSND